MKQKTTTVAKEACHVTKNENCFSHKRKKTGDIKKYLILMVFFLNLSFILQSQIPSAFWGLNGWMTGTIGVSTASISPGNTLSIPYNPSGLFSTFASSAFTNLATKVSRYGGTAHDINLPASPHYTATVAQYTAFINQCNSSGVAPIIQIPFLNAWYIAGGGTTAIVADSYTTMISNLVTTLSSDSRGNPFFI